MADVKNERLISPDLGFGADTLVRWFWGHSCPRLNHLQGKTSTPATTHLTAQIWPASLRNPAQGLDLRNFSPRNPFARDDPGRQNYEPTFSIPPPGGRHALAHNRLWPPPPTPQTRQKCPLSRIIKHHQDHRGGFTIRLSDDIGWIIFSPASKPR